MILRLLNHLLSKILIESQRNSSQTKTTHNIHLIQEKLLWKFLEIWMILSTKISISSVKPMNKRETLFLPPRISPMRLKLSTSILEERLQWPRLLSQRKRRQPRWGRLTNTSLAPKDTHLAWTNGSQTYWIIIGLFKPQTIRIKESITMSISRWQPRTLVTSQLKKQRSSSFCQSLKLRTRSQIFHLCLISKKGVILVTFLRTKKNH